MAFISGAVRDALILMGGKVRDRVRIYCDSGTNRRDDPARFDWMNWTANNAEIDHMLEKVAFMRESLPKSIDAMRDVRETTHTQASPVGMMAASHMLSTIPNFLVYEWHWSHPASRWQQWRDYVKEGDIIEKGHSTAPDRPGIGVVCVGAGTQSAG